MIKIFFILNFLQVGNRIEVQTHTDENFLIPESNEDYEYFISMLKYAMKYQEPLAFQILEDSIINQVFSCEHYTVSSINDADDNRYRISLSPSPGVFYLEKKEEKIHQLLEKSLIEKEKIWVGVDNSNIVAADFFLE